MSPGNSANPGQSTGSKRSASPLFVTDDSAPEKRIKIDPTVDGGPANSFLSAVFPDTEKRFSATHRNRPAIPIYHPLFHPAEDEVAGICDDLKADVEEFEKRTGYKSQPLDRILAKSVIEFERPQSLYARLGSVAFVGPAGVGKSSMFNCLLDKPDVALETDGGRGTYVVTEHTKALQSQRGKHEVTLIYMSRDQIEQHVAQQYDFMKARLQPDEEDDESDEGTDGAKEDEQALDQGMHSAVKFCTDLLGDKRPFRSPEHVKKWFEAKFAQGKVVAVKELMAYIDNYKASRKLDSDMEVIASSGNDTLNEILLPVTRPQRNETSPWPVLRRASVGHFDCDLLNAGVTLADTPGVTDNNLNVVNNTLKYFRGAHTVLLVAEHKRIEHEGSINEQLRQCIAAGKSRSVKLIVTKIDSKDVYRGPEREELEHSAQQLLNTVETTIQDLKTRLAENKQDKKKAKKSSDNDRKKFVAQGKRLNKELSDAKARLKTVSVQIRCVIIWKEMRSRLRELTRSSIEPDLPIFFVSNSQYKMHMTRSKGGEDDDSDDDDDGGDDSDTPFLPLELTGIPGLRQALYEVPGSNFDTLKHVALIRLPIALRGMLGVVTKPVLSRKKDVAALIKTAMSTVSQIVREIAQAYIDHFRTSVIRLRASQESHWKEATLQSLSQWATKYSGSPFTAFCRKSGVHKSKGKTPTSLNDELSEIVARDFGTVFDRIRSRELPGIYDQVCNHIKDLFASLIRELKECQDFQGADSEPFYEYIYRVRDQALADSQGKFRRLTRKLDLIFNNAVVPSQASYMAAAMEPIWAHCAKMTAVPKQRGRPPRGQQRVTLTTLRIEAIRFKVRGGQDEPSLFDDLVGNLMDASENIVNNWEIFTSRILEDSAKDILRDFDRRYEVTEVKTENPEHDAEVCAIISKHLARTEGSLKGKIEACEEYGKTGISSEMPLRQKEAKAPNGGEDTIPS